MSPSTIHTTVHVYCMWLLWAPQSKDQQKQDGQTLRCTVYMPEHESRSLRTRHWRKHYGIFASFKKIFLPPWLSKPMLSDNESQMVGAERELRLMIEGWDITKLREYCAGRGMAIHYAPCPTSEWMLWSSGQVHEVRPQESRWRSRSYPLRALHLPSWSCKSIEWTTHRQNTKRPRWWRLFLSK